MSWRGIAFEEVCWCHWRQIKRNDHVMNMCEVKFYNEEFAVDKAYHKVLVHRENLLEKALPKRMVVHPTLITTEGLRYNEYSGDFQKVVVLDDLFGEV